MKMLSIEKKIYVCKYVPWSWFLMLVWFLQYNTVSNLNIKFYKLVYIREQKKSFQSKLSSKAYETELTD